MELFGKVQDISSLLQKKRRKKKQNKENVKNGLFICLYYIYRILGEYCKTLNALQVRECRDITEISLAR